MWPELCKQFTQFLAKIAETVAKKTAKKLLKYQLHSSIWKPQNCYIKLPLKHSDTCNNKPCFETLFYRKCKTDATVKSQRYMNEFFSVGQGTLT